MDAPLPAEERLQFTDLSDARLAATLGQVLNAKVHGLSFSAYLDHQSPAQRTQLTAANIRQRLQLVAPYTRWVRSFSCTDGNEHVPPIAKSLGLKTMVGAWLGKTPETNERELEALISLAREGWVDIAAVGNEVLLREDLDEGALLTAINRFRSAAPGVPVGTVDAYSLFCDHPRLVDACDVLLINCYPFWEECRLEYSLSYMKEMYRRVQRVAGGKPIIISETGWPSDGTAVGEAMPSQRNALLYALNTFEWAALAGIDLMYFSSFDEAWKAGPEGDCGAHWGFWDTTGQAKYGWR